MDVKELDSATGKATISIEDYNFASNDAFTASQRTHVSTALLFTKLLDICSKEVEPSISTAHPTHGPFRLSRNKASQTGLMVITKLGKKVCMVTEKELMSNPSSSPVSIHPVEASGSPAQHKLAGDKHTKLFRKQYLLETLRQLSEHLPCAQADKGPFRVHFTKSAGYTLVNKDKTLVFDLYHYQRPERRPTEADLGGNKHLPSSLASKTKLLQHKLTTSVTPKAKAPPQFYKTDKLYNIIDEVRLSMSNCELIVVNLFRREHACKNICWSGLKIQKDTLQPDWDS